MRDRARKLGVYDELSLAGLAKFGISWRCREVAFVKEINGTNYLHHWGLEGLFYCGYTVHYRYKLINRVSVNAILNYIPPI